VPSTIDITYIDTTQYRILCTMICDLINNMIYDMIYEGYEIGLG